MSIGSIIRLIASPLFRQYGNTFQSLKMLRFITIASLILGWFFWPAWILSAYLMAFGMVYHLYDWSNKAIACSPNGMYDIALIAYMMVFAKVCYLYAWSNNVAAPRNLFTIESRNLFAIESRSREFLIKLTSVLCVVHNKCFPSACSPYMPLCITMEFAPPAPPMSRITTRYLGGGNVFSPSMGHVGVDDYTNNRYVSTEYILKYVYASVFVFTASIFAVLAFIRNFFFN